jgi:hypothetical protein
MRFWRLLTLNAQGGSLQFFLLFCGYAQLSDGIGGFLRFGIKRLVPIMNQRAMIKILWVNHY